MKITTQNKLNILTPGPGLTLTQVLEVDLQDRIFSKKLYLGKYDSPDNYTEISDQEAEELQKQLEEILKEQEENPENNEE